MESGFAATLKGLNMKVTPKRIAILEILSKESIYLSPEEVWQMMRQRFKSIGLPTVYRNLEDLSNGGAITKVIHPDRKLYYFSCGNPGHHHHFVCISCRRVEDISFCGRDEIENEVNNTLKGKVLSHVLQVYGICNACINEKKGGI
ncbi:MAG TPA: transcriptional repressor [Syntrophorhabdaceae bacterium]|nr:transcriptional repressor [Syntrophorhabdaceae bacterium]HOL06529.1 transcriptional repressor [Syntrophorhabdaceae bacterium]HON86312.1 transcriptional repressor [Syntrophorhabdaceae bacterium]HOT42693.1 transcriptional repressor [Syntrophorhabdaceae bacterium]HPC67624.1 transcriptional repressor [Syntrophorhabdaceae bacterium]